MKENLHFFNETPKKVLNEEERKELYAIREKYFKSSQNK